MYSINFIMDFNTTILRSDHAAIKVSVEEDGKTVGWAYVYLIENDLHDAPYGYLENVFVEEPFRGKGYGSALVKAAIEEAKKLGCYKLIGTSRHTKPEVHEFYERLGFKNHGLEFR